MVNRRQYREVVLEAAILAACSAGPVKWGVVQYAVNVTAEHLFGDISQQGTTLPAYPLAMRLAAHGKLIVHHAEDFGCTTTYETVPLSERTKR